MKYSDIRPSPIELFILIAVFCVLTGCVKKEERPEGVSFDDSQRQQYMKLRENNELIAAVPYTAIHRVCIDGVFYLSHSHTLVRQDDRNGRPVACEKKNGQ